MSDTRVPERVVAALAEYYRRNGYVRRKNEARALQAEPQAYKKGDEVRLVAESLGELLEIRRLLAAAGFRPGRPFKHVNQIRQPIYGRSEVARFLALIRGTSPA